MELIKKYFKKEPNEVTLEDVISFCKSHPKEDTRIEIKGAPANIKLEKTLSDHVYRTVCGFLNSEGGLLIWGGPDEKGRNHQGEVSPVAFNMSFDWLNQKISSNIHAYPNGIFIQPIEVGSNLYIFLIDVPPSPFRPHQTNNIYYIRRDGSTEPAQHYLIEALFRQVKIPDLRLLLELTSNRTEGRIRYLDFYVEISNAAPYMHATDVTVFLQSPFGKILDSVQRLSFDFKGYHNPPSKEIPIKKRIPFGLPHFFTFVLAFPESYFGGKHNKLLLQFYYLDKRSPIKTSSYEVALDIIQRGDIDDSLIPIVQGKFIHDMEW